MRSGSAPDCRRFCHDQQRPRLFPGLPDVTAFGQNPGTGTAGPDENAAAGRDPDSHRGFAGSRASQSPGHPDNPCGSYRLPLPLYPPAQTQLTLRCHPWRHTRRSPGSDRLRCCQPDHRAGWADPVSSRPSLATPPFLDLALRYQEDYRVAGLPVLPAAKGEHYTKTFILLYASSLIPLSLLLWFFSYCSAGFAVAALLAGGIFLASLIRFLFFKPHFLQAFRATNGYLTVILLLIVADICLQ